MPEHRAKLLFGMSGMWFASVVRVGCVARARTAIALESVS
jgi:hypothetical protein